MAKLLAKGTLPISVCEDTFIDEKTGEEKAYYYVEIKISESTTERAKLKAPSSYELLTMKLNSQMKLNPSSEK